MNANRIKRFLNKIRRCLTHVLLLGATEKLHGWEKLHAKTVAWSYDMEGHGRYVFQTAFFLRSMNTDMYICTYTYTYIYIHIHIHTHTSNNTCTYTRHVHIHACACACVSLCFLLCGAVSCRVRVVRCWCGVVWCGVVWCGVVWCGVVWCGVVWCGVVWCGVLLSTCRCRGGPCPWSFQLRMMSFLQRARAERSMIERRVGQYSECVVLVPFSK